MAVEKVQRLLAALNEGLYEKEHVMALTLLSAVAGESIFLLGPPGVAKSMIARRLKEAFAGASAFEYLMSRFSTPDEIFGPVSISKLKDEDCYERVVDGYLPSADVVFLDEIWKAGPGIQNALLTVLNEKIYKNGRQQLHVPLKGLIAASNELPAEGEGLEALWDRFLLRCMVTGIHRNDLFDRMIADVSSPTDLCVPGDLKITVEQLALWREGSSRVALSGILFTFIHRLRDELARHNAACAEKDTDDEIWVSDRRWKKTVNLMRTAAFLNGASEVRLADALLLQHCLWTKPGQTESLATLIRKALVQTLEEEAWVPLLQERVESLRNAFRTQGESRKPDTGKLKVVQSFYYQVQTVRMSQKMLMYTNEYQQLSADSPTPFILVTDRYKTGAQILKKYEKSRYPGIFPKDILQVTAAQDAVVINGRTYPLLTETAAAEPEPTGTSLRVVDAELVEALKRLMQNTTETLETLERICKRETDSASGHLFLYEGQKQMLEQACRSATNALYRLDNELRELRHACGCDA